MMNPPSGVKLTMQAACIMFDVKPLLRDDPGTMGKKVKDYWTAAHKSLLSDPARFLAGLKEYNRDNIPERLIAEIEPFIAMPEFEPAVIERASKACHGICLWVRAMHLYYNVVKMVGCAHCYSFRSLFRLSRDGADPELFCCAFVPTFLSVCTLAGGAQEAEAGGGAGGVGSNHGRPERGQETSAGRAGQGGGAGGAVRRS